MAGQSEVDGKLLPSPDASPAQAVIEAERRLSSANTEEEIAFWAEMFAEDLVMGDYVGSEDSTRTQGAVVEWFKGMKSALPDLRVEVKRLTCEGRVVAEEGVIEGTHTGTPLLGQPASGRRVSWPFCSLKEVSPETGQIATDYSILMDSSFVLAQLQGE